jgi:pSer/pThr/pTyr-binding forkhead associated (FHA) protein
VYLIDDNDSKNGTWVNDRKIADDTPLGADDIIRIGTTEFVFRAPAASPPDIEPAPLRLAQLVPAAGEPISLDGDMIRLGRSLNNEVVVPDPAASRCHAMIQRDGEVYWIEDQGGPNGTRVNGQRVAARTALLDGDTIRIGETGFTFRLVSTPAPRVPPPDAPSLSPDPSISAEIRGLLGESVPGPITGLIRELDQAAPATPPSQPGLTAEIRALDASGKPPTPAGPPGLSAEIRALDAPGKPPTPAGPPGLSAEIRALDARPLAAPVLLLQATSGPAKGQTFRIGETGASLGRARDNTIQILDESVSRRHAQIEFKDGGFWIGDVDSASGTAVNRERVTKPRRLQSGDVIEIGATRLKATLKQ